MTVIRTRFWGHLSVGAAITICSRENHSLDDKNDHGFSTHVTSTSLPDNLTGYFRKVFIINQGGSDKTLYHPTHGMLVSLYPSLQFYVPLLFCTFMD